MVEPLLRKQESQDSYTPSGGGWDEDGDGEADGWGDYDDDEMQDLSHVPADLEHVPVANEKGYKKMEVSSIRDTVIEKISELRELYGLDDDALILIARHYKWNEERMQDWFINQDRLKYTLGVEFDPKNNKDANMQFSLPQHHGGYCLICYDTITPSTSFSLACGHTFCKDCWREHLKERLMSGFQGIDCQCMQVGCNLKVGHSHFLKLLAPASLAKVKDTYWKWLCKSFTDDNRNIRWCPSAGCGYYYERTNLSQLIYEVQCECGTLFCFLCGNHSHLPCSCETASAWSMKASAESENITWIAANTKICPKCKKHIEKNQGCNHMTCIQCRHEFCWICMGDWKDHGTATGGYYKCNKYEELKKDPSFNAEERKREDAKHELQRYMFHYERYANHDKSGKLAKELKPKIATKIELLAELKNYPLKELEFLEDACQVVIDCRNVLKWTYAYGYYELKNYSNEGDKNLFQHWQEDLEKFCDHLHGLVESDLDRYVDPNIVDRSPFYKFRGELVSFYDATRNYYRNLINGIRDQQNQLV